MNDPDRSGPANGHGDDRASRLSAAILRISLSLDLATVLAMRPSKAPGPSPAPAPRDHDDRRTETGPGLPLHPLVVHPPALDAEHVRDASVGVD